MHRIFFFFVSRLHSLHCFTIYRLSLVWLRLWLCDVSAIYLFHHFQLFTMCADYCVFCLWCLCCAPFINHWNVNTHKIVHWRPIQLRTILVFQFMRSVFSFSQFFGRWYGAMLLHVHTRTSKICSREKHHCVQLCWRHGLK